MTFSAYSAESAFERSRRVFRLLEREFYLQFIPSIHFQEALRQVLEMLTTSEFTGESGNPAGNGHLFRPLRRLLEEKIYEILFDVLLYQNGERVDIDTLKRKTSPLEIAEFLDLILTDAEIIRALEVVAGSLGKLLTALTDVPFPIANSTPSS
jgi:hypothetical protein